MPVRLYRLPGSHYAERAEALLHLKGVDYERVTLGYRDVLRRLPRETGHDRVPVVRWEDGRVSGWREVGAELEARHPDPPLYPADAAARREVAWWEDLADLALGHAARRLGYWEMRERPDLRRRFFRARGPLGDLRSRALLAYFMRAYGVTAWNREDDGALVARLMERVAEALEAGDGAHLVARRLTAADVAVATLAFPIAATPAAARLGPTRAWEWVRATRARLRPPRRAAAPPAA